MSSCVEERAPKQFGGMGGVDRTVPFDAYTEDLFAQAVQRALGECVRADRQVAKALWCALANVQWHHTTGDYASYSFRAAGDLVASLRDEGYYLDWYCCGPDGTVSEQIAEAMKAEGWEYSFYE